MNRIWSLTNWKSNPILNQKSKKSGIRLRFDQGINADLRMECLNFINWLRKQYCFPVRVTIYVKNQRRIKAKDGELVCGTCWMPFDYSKEPHIRIATGDYAEMCSKKGRKHGLYQILWCFAHELTHYFQWLNNINLSLIGEERQASRIASFVLEQYADTKDDLWWSGMT